MSRFFLFFFVAFMTAACMNQKSIAQKIKPEFPNKVQDTDFTTEIYTIKIDKNFTESERQSIVESFKTWEISTKNVVIFKIENTPWDSDEEDAEVNEDISCSFVVYVQKIASNNSIVKRIDKSGGGKTLGFTSSTCKFRYIGYVTDRLKNSDMFVHVATHEVGHLVGLDHIPVPDESIMFPSINHAKKCITELDMKQFCMLHGCDWKNMNYCKSELFISN